MTLQEMTSGNHWFAIYTNVLQHFAGQYWDTFLGFIFEDNQISHLQPVQSGPFVRNKQSLFNYRQSHWQAVAGNEMIQVSHITSNDQFTGHDPLHMQPSGL